MATATPHLSLRLDDRAAAHEIYANVDSGELRSLLEDVHRHILDFAPRNPDRTLALQALREVGLRYMEARRFPKGD